MYSCLSFTSTDNNDEQLLVRTILVPFLATLVMNSGWVKHVHTDSFSAQHVNVMWIGSLESTWSQEKPSLSPELLSFRQNIAHISRYLGAIDYLWASSRRIDHSHACLTNIIVIWVKLEEYSFLGKHTKTHLSTQISLARGVCGTHSCTTLILPHCHNDSSQSWLVEITYGYLNSTQKPIFWPLGWCCTKWKLSVAAVVAHYPVTTCGSINMMCAIYKWTLCVHIGAFVGCKQTLQYHQAASLFIHNFTKSLFAMAQSQLNTTCWHVSIMYH